MIEITEETKTQKHIYKRRFFVIKNEKGLYWRYSWNFVDDISIARTFNTECKTIEAAQYMLRNYADRKAFEKLFVQEVKLVEVEE